MIIILVYYRTYTHIVQAHVYKMYMHTVDNS